MGVLSNFQQLDENSVKLWNDLLEEKTGRYEGMGLEIEEVLGMRDNACSLDVCFGCVGDDPFYSR
ncbi:hypothetical protein Pyn_24345 [Prunus yedoensis var. nudiflora]|uniref:Uncharacterized protein n=1 Tax=Prunus yedoensis var. nudiflora TaxID=2094558 RepID=A0A314ZUR1_PRUYE|nr:hypothetical protein Pyn_24345 [Prunus yedoensis var. nudiflora]